MDRLLCRRAWWIGHARFCRRHRRKRAGVRARICEGLDFLGIEIETKSRNAEECAPVISTDGQPVKVRVIRTDEELMIARSVLPHSRIRHIERKELNMKTNTLTPELLHKMDAYWRAANYLSVGQIYLYDNPLLKRPLALADVKHMLLGHWGTTPGQNFIYVHLNRVIKKYDLDMIYVSGPGHGGPAVVGNTYLEGTYSEIYPNISQDEAGLQKLFMQFSFPGGIPSHASPESPGSIHEGGELGYSLSHSFGAVFDNPDLDRRLRGRRWRGGNRPAGDRVAFQQISQSGHRRRGAADPASQRLQDFQPDRPRPHHARGIGTVVPRLRLDALLRRGSRTGS